MLLSDLMKDLEHVSNLSSSKKTAADKKIRTSLSKKQGPSDLATRAASKHPAQCPFNTGDLPRPGCWFEPKLFIRMIEQDVFADFDGCPYRAKCKLRG